MSSSKMLIKKNSLLQFCEGGKAHHTLFSSDHKKLSQNQLLGIALTIISYPGIVFVL